ncbi:MAG: hypothetical protein JO235_05305 [Chroococcidiopsidaceae cyanobacterium CP_BM_RX_35]|nr:hypothetical protein [Chroococcidiopsidaceae cyanobacterium CP_BM_RX_35]
MARAWWVDILLRLQAEDSQKPWSPKAFALFPEPVPWCPQVLKNDCIFWFSGFVYLSIARAMFFKVFATLYDELGFKLN